MIIDRRKKNYPGITKLGADMSVPDGRLSEVMGFYRGSLSEQGLRSAVWGHIGDNHLHVNVLPADMEEYARTVRLFREEWAPRITAMGGAVSAEQGIGKLKTGFLLEMYGEDHVREMAALKKQLDPGCVFGLGNLFGEDFLR